MTVVLPSAFSEVYHLGNIVFFRHNLTVIMSTIIRNVVINIVRLRYNFIMKRLKNIVYPLEHFRVPQGDRAPPFQKTFYTLLPFSLHFASLYP